jgi:ParB family chromosome partitioning protein
MVARGELTEGHARAVLALPDHDDRKRLAKRIVREGMSVRGAERAAQDAGATRRPRVSARVDPALAERARLAAEHVTGMPARVSAGKLELHFGNEMKLEELVETLESL